MFSWQGCQLGVWHRVATMFLFECRTNGTSYIYKCYYQILYFGEINNFISRVHVQIAKYNFSCVITNVIKSHLSHSSDFFIVCNSKIFLFYNRTIIPYLFQTVPLYCTDRMFWFIGSWKLFELECFVQTLNISDI